MEIFLREVGQREAFFSLPHKPRPQSKNLNISKGNGEKNSKFSTKLTQCPSHAMTVQCHAQGLSHNDVYGLMDYLPFANHWPSKTLVPLPFI